MNGLRACGRLFSACCSALQPAMLLLAAAAPASVPVGVQQCVQHGCAHVRLTGVRAERSISFWLHLAGPACLCSAAILAEDALHEHVRFQARGWACTKADSP